MTNCCANDNAGVCMSRIGFKPFAQGVCMSSTKSWYCSPSAFTYFKAMLCQFPSFTVFVLQAKYPTQPMSMPTLPPRRKTILPCPALPPFFQSPSAKGLPTIVPAADVVLNLADKMKFCLPERSQSFCESCFAASLFASLTSPSNSPVGFCSTMHGVTGAAAWEWLEYAAAKPAVPGCAAVGVVSHVIAQGTPG